MVKAGQKNNLNPLKCTGVVLIESGIGCPTANRRTCRT
ncbi:hypothetical protein TcasGA2_TC009689 [Tribolium castaneum]|uniref:Uncharacterized protein n=1 Tax=Tribolium castaneum TaxID=7070 RepID=D6WU36_TRICA|nr:hypothetical protein TcasGA2_TC009689 [Tribolium castaneum]